MPTSADVTEPAITEPPGTSPIDGVPKSELQPGMKPFPRFRNTLIDFLALSARKHTFPLFTTFDVTVYTTFAEECRRRGQKPPSLTAYIARCLGVLLARHPQMMAARLGKNLLIPGEVNLIVTMEVPTAQGDLIPLLVKIGTVDRKTLPELGAELREKARFYKSTPFSEGRLYKAAFWFAGRSKWARRATYATLGILPGSRRRIAELETCVGLNSITSFSNGRSGWLLPSYPYTATVTLGGLSRQPMVVDEEIVPRDCLNVTFVFDHAVVDGAPAMRFIAEFAREVESGRLLAEFQL